MCRALGGKRREAKEKLCCGIGMSLDPDHTCEEGCWPYVPVFVRKPFDREEFLGCMKKLMGLAHEEVVTSHG